MATYCPTCGESVDETVTECAQCGTELVETRPGPPPDPTIRLTSVLATGDPALIAFAKSLLDAEGLEYGVRAEGLQQLFGWGSLGAGYSILTGPAEFVVREEDAHRARELLRDLRSPSQPDDGSTSEET
jgi:hypothetical protein